MADTTQMMGVGTDIASADVLAGREVIEEMGLTVELWLKLGDLQRAQLSLLIEDYKITFADRSSKCVMLEHLERRLRHLNSGARQGAEIFKQAIDQYWAMEDALWRPFLRLLYQDVRHTNTTSA